ncbi:hypothetical protein HN865_04050 [Candidatus Woesearchaeota archaeon]|nr:hypothetical protein [Candidatus Woesearchaeota archaeon]
MKKSLIIIFSFLLVFSFVMGDSYELLSLNNTSTVEKIVDSTSRASCGTTINTNTVLTNDLINCGGNGINIGASGIILDCNGHIIDGINADTRGIYSLNYNNIEIKNCIIQEFTEGIVINGGYGVTIQNIEAKNNINGIHLQGNAYYNYLFENNLAYNIDGLKIEDSSANAIINNILQNNSANGILVIRSSANNFSGNTFLDNTINGYERADSNGNFWNLNITGNFWDDIESNPGYPDYYIISGPGDGIDWHPLNSPPHDEDRDGTPDFEDNCVYTFNPTQKDFDRDGVGDWCDNCIMTSNFDQEDLNGNYVGDVCEGLNYVCSIRQRTKLKPYMV